MSTPFISVKNLCFTYDEDPVNGRKILDNVSFDIEKGDFVCILGHNGSGKSTLAKLLNLILAPTGGEILIDGIPVREDMTEDEVYALRQKVGMVFQNPDNQLVTTIVEEDVAFGPENIGLPPEEIRRRVDASLATVGMTEFARHSTHQLSGGQKQRIAIAGVIAMQPDCIIFDESTAMLDPMGRKAIMDTILRLNREHGITVIHITHNMDEATLSDRVIVIDDGKIYLDGTPKEVFSKVRELNRAGLDVPQVTDLFYELNEEAGFDLPDGIIDMDEGAEILADAIMALAKKKRQ